MGSVERYIFRTTMGAFLLVLVSVTMLMWITQAVRNLDVMTDQGQDFLVFLGITALVIPMLVMIIAPFALMIAIAHVLTKMGNDSEIIVMNSAGMAPWQVFRPFLFVGIIVTAMVAFISCYLSPKCLRELRLWATDIRAEMVTVKVQPGRFLTVEGNLTMHIRERLANGQLSGIMLDDQRDPKERVTIIAERGDLLNNERGLFLVLENGAVHRLEAGQRDPVIVGFMQYAFDMSRLSPGPSTIEYSMQERPFTDLLWRRPNERAAPNRMRSELYTRLAVPLYPLAFLVLTFAYLGAPRTTRQSRAMSLVNAILAATAVRAVGFVGTVSGTHSRGALIAPFIALAIAFVLGGIAIWRGLIIEPPAFVTKAITAIVEGFSRRRMATAGSAP